jgi:phage head maturation protease
MILRGYAIVFNQLAAACMDDGADFELVFEGAFDDMLARRKTITLQYGPHDPAPAIARTTDGTLCLFADAHGLGFEADTGAKLNWQQLSSMYKCGMNRASVNFTRMVSEVGRASTRYVSRAEIDHITITSHAAYRQTAVWRSDSDLQHAPDRIQSAAAHWEHGRAQAVAQKSRQERANRRVASTNRSHPNPKVADFRFDGNNHQAWWARAMAAFTPAELRAIVEKNPQLWRDTPIGRSVAATPSQRRR